MSRETMIALGGGCLSAFGTFAFLIGVPGGMLFAYLAPIPLLLAGLGMGIKAVAIAGAGGVLVTGVLGNIMTAVVYGGLFAVPAWLIVRLALSGDSGDGPDKNSWYPVGSIVAWLSAISAALILGGGLMLSGGETSIAGKIALSLDVNLSTIMGALDEDQRALFVEEMTPMFLGAVGTSWIIMMIVNSVLAQRVLEKTGRNLRPKPHYASLAMPDWISWSLVGAAVLALAGSGDMAYLGRNLAMILALPFLLLGLGVAHTITLNTPGRGVLLPVIYMVLIISSGFKLAMAAIGLLEQWVGIRRRFAGPAHNKEEE